MALNAFLQQISDMLVQRASKNQAGDKAVFKYFIQKFRGIIDNPQSDTKALSSAIKGYGFFAAPCKLFMSEDDVKFMFTEMIQRSEQLYLQQGDIPEDSLTQLPDFLDALASIVQHLNELSDSFLGSLERLVVIQFSNYPRIPRFKYYQCHGASLRVLIALSAKGATLKTFLSRVVYQALVRTCSHPVLMEVSELPEGAGGVEGATDAEDIKSDARRVSYKSYIDLWKHLLDSAYMKEMEAFGMGYIERCKIHQMIYGELIASTLRILGKLVLTSNKQGQGDNQNESVAGPSDVISETDASSYPLHGLQATKPITL
ncbi:DNA-dependent protein kinase catalytic subunit-like [Amphiura filiformis]|uniref:DNA-dependent protein kinase catalytic subunit-like n=1 Tax=Amphiura filiformis TaxID=82378 RepID=UPI003B21659B